MPNVPPYPDIWEAAHPWPAYPSVPTPPHIYGPPGPVPTVIPTGVEPRTARPGRRRGTSDTYVIRRPEPEGSEAFTTVIPPSLDRRSRNDSSYA